MFFSAKRRIIFIISLSIFLFSLLFIKLGYITFISSNKINYYAYKLWSREVPITSSRGLILDRNGNVIVDNKICYTIYSINRQIKDKDYTATILAKELNVTKDSILAHLNKNNSIETINPEGRKIDEEVAYNISQYNLDGIYITCDTKRNYPYGSTLGQVLGFCGIDGYGLSGIEYMYNDYLESQKGSIEIYTDAKGNLLHNKIYDYNEATNGLNISLTIDINLQLIMDNVIKEAVSLYNPDQVMGLMVSAKTGEVLAISSYPFFDPANYQDYSEEIYSRNLPIFYQFELGSTFKVITYAAGLEENVFDLNDSIYCGGYTIVGGRKIKCWKSGGHKNQTFLEGIENSCNVCFMEIAMRLGVDNFYKYLDIFSLTEKTGIDLVGEGSPIIVSKDNCGSVELATQSFGQASAYTPIMLSMATISAVNGGSLFKPYILNSISTTYGDLLYQNEPKIKKKTISEKTSNLMKYALESVVARGSGRNSFVEGYRVGGKTGTAQVISLGGGYESGHYILSFCGLAPMNDPEILCYLAIDNAKDCIQYGGTIVAPLVGKILEESLSYLGVERDYEYQIEKNLRWYLDVKTYTVSNYIGKTKTEIKNTSNYNFIFYGDGTKVIYQSPSEGEKINEGDTIMLYLG